MSNKSFNEFESEGQGNKLLKKSKDSPFVPIGKRNQVNICVINRCISHGFHCLCVYE